MTTGVMRLAIVTMTTDVDRIPAAETTTDEMTIIVVVMITTTRRIIVGTTIRTADNHGTPKGITDRKMSARSDGALRTTIDEDLDSQGPNHLDRRNSKNSNWYP